MVESSLNPVEKILSVPGAHVFPPLLQPNSQPAALDSAVGAGTIGSETLTSTVPSDLNSVHTDSAPVHTALAPVPSDLVAVHSDSAPVHTDFAPVSLITLFGHRHSTFPDPEVVPMNYAKTILPEFDREMANTRKVLEHVPENKLDWQAHPKSHTIG